MTGAAATVETGIQNFPHVVLENGDWKLLVADPTVDDPYYQGTRFVWSGMVAKAWWRGVPVFIEHSLDEPMGHHDRAGGTAEEFDIEGTPEIEATPVGGEFLKIGVGILERDVAEPYFFARSYPIIQMPVRTMVKRDAKSVVFDETLENSALGLGYRLQIEIVLKGNAFLVQRKLTNLGAKPLVTEHYCHNFIRLGDATIGPDVRLSWRGKMRFLSQKGETGVLALDDGSIGFERNPEKLDFSVQAAVPRKFRGPVKVTSAASGLELSFTSSEPLSRFAIWGERDRVCPELFNKFEIQPGEAVEWSTTVQMDEVN